MSADAGGAARIEAIYISPVKSLALVALDRAHVGPDGIYEDRRFFLSDERGRLITQREYGSLVRIMPSYTREPEQLRLRFPNGSEAAAAPREGESIIVRFFGKRDVEGTVVEGPWAAALSAFTGRPLRLVRAARTAFDALPVSLCSDASVAALRAQTEGVAVDARRFRPNFVLSGLGAHGEDAWVGRSVRIGAAVVHMRLRDPRCAIINHNPDTGERDLNTLKVITSYRTDQPREVNFGVYGTVEREGVVAVGDTVAPLADGVAAPSE
ncbi:MAG: MOSC domain-containing protein [Dehalococcoidia bacterium]